MLWFAGGGADATVVEAGARSLFQVELRADVTAGAEAGVAFAPVVADPNVGADVVMMLKLGLLLSSKGT